MKKIAIIILSFFLLFTVLGKSKETTTVSLNLIKTINCSSVSDLKKYNISRFVLTYKSGKRIKGIKGTYLNQVIQKEMSDLNNLNYENLLFKAISKSGETIGFTYNEISEKFAKIPVIIGFVDNVKFRDSIEISGFEGTKLSENQKSKFDAIFTNFQVYKVRLQMSAIPKTDIDKIFKDNFMIFPMDQTSSRWIGNLEKIEIYKLN